MKKIIHPYILDRLRKLLYSKSKSKFYEMSSSDIFEMIYNENYWGDNKSGPGSTLSATKAISIFIQDVIVRFQINSILDLGCGNFEWMNGIIQKFDIYYLGGDIVEELIERNKDKYENNNISFYSCDMTKDKFKFFRFGIYSRYLGSSIIGRYTQVNREYYKHIKSISFNDYVHQTIHKF